MACPRRPIALALTLLLAVVALPGGVASARSNGPGGMDVPIPTNHPGADPDAPPGAPAIWLPNEAWVMTHWLPYREHDLRRELRTNRAELRAWLAHKPLADLARAKGLDPDRVLERVLRPVRREYPRNMVTLRANARRTFTQRHLMQHMLFHPVHLDAYNGMVPRLLGLGWPKLNAMRRQGLSLADIARRQHVDPDAAMRKIQAAMLAASLRGIRAQLTPRAQARAFRAEQRRILRIQWHMVRGRRGTGHDHMGH